MQTTVTTTAVIAADTLAAELELLGFVEGAPPHIPADLVAGDVASYRRMRCASCGRGGHKVQPYHRGREYRLLCSCIRCGAGKEC